MDIFQIARVQYIYSKMLVSLFLIEDIILIFEILVFRFHQIEFLCQWKIKRDEHPFVSLFVCDLADT